MRGLRGVVGDRSLLWRFSSFVDLTDGEVDVLLSIMGPPVHVAPKHSLHTQESQPGLYFLHDGWVTSGIDVADGSRQVVKIHRPGDIMGSTSLPFACAVETLTALTPSKVSVIGRGAIGTLFTEWPRLGAVLFLASQVERVVLMDRLVALERLDATRSFTALLVQLFRTRPPGTEGDRLHLPLTQSQIGEVLGLSSVHVSRVVTKLEGERLIRRDGHTYHFLDLPRLERSAGLPSRVPERNLPWFPPASPRPVEPEA